MITVSKDYRETIGFPEYAEEVRRWSSMQAIEEFLSCCYNLEIQEYEIAQTRITLRADNPRVYSIIAFVSEEKEMDFLVKLAQSFSDAQKDNLPGKIRISKERYFAYALLRFGGLGKEEAEKETPNYDGASLSQFVDAIQLRHDYPGKPILDILNATTAY